MLVCKTVMHTVADDDQLNADTFGSREIPEEFGEPAGQVGAEPQEEISHEDPHDDVQNDFLTVSHFRDHFSLPAPSNTVRFRHSRGGARVIKGGTSQYILEEIVNPESINGHHLLTIRRIHDTSEGARVLRAVYALVTVVWSGFFFVFCIELFIFLVLDLAAELGITESQDHKWKHGGVSVQAHC